MFPHIIKDSTSIKSSDPSSVKCSICNAKFSIAEGAPSAIKRHNLTETHRKAAVLNASSKKITDLIQPISFGNKEKTLALSEGLFAYHTVRHSHSFRSMDCTSKIIQKLFLNNFGCARTKCEAIVCNVYKEFVMKKLAIDLKDANFITILSDASNHNSTKLYPIVVRYFSFKTGVQIKILHFESIDQCFPNFFELWHSMIKWRNSRHIKKSFLTRNLGIQKRKVLRYIIEFIYYI